MLGLALAMGVPTAPAAAQTILNVERLDPGDVQGHHWGVEGSFSLAQGNSDYTDLDGGVAWGYRWTSDWLRLFTGLDYRAETTKRVENDRYAHARYNHFFGDAWRTFHFVQFQASHTGRLQQRFLVGTGLRRRLIDGPTTLDIGTGAMFEREDLDPARVTGPHPVESRVWRMANLIVVRTPITESVRLVGVGYVQPDFGAFGDVRTLTDLSLLISLTENLDLSVRNEWRHDSRAPLGVKPNDLVLKVGFTVSFR